MLYRENSGDITNLEETISRDGMMTNSRRTSRPLSKKISGYENFTRLL